MKKSLKKFVLFSLSAVTLASVSANTVALAAADPTAPTETEEVAVEGDSAESESVESEAVEDEDVAEASALQLALEAVLESFQADYPEATVTEISIELQDVEDETADASDESDDSAESDDAAESDEGSEGGDDTTKDESSSESSGGSIGAEPATAEPAATDPAATDPAASEESAASDTVVEVTSLAYDITIKGADNTNAYTVTYDSTTEAVVDEETTALAEADANGVIVDAEGIDVTTLVELDAVTAAALQTAGYGVATNYKLDRDDAVNENPVWTVEVEEGEDGRAATITIDAVTGEVLSAEGDVAEAVESEVADDAAETDDTEAADDAEVTEGEQDTGGTETQSTTDVSSDSSAPAPGAENGETNPEGTPTP